MSVKSNSVSPDHHESGACVVKLDEEITKVLR